MRWRASRRSTEKQKRLLVVGDSNSARYQPGCEPNWPTLLARRFEGRLTVINESMDGRTAGFDQGALNAKHCLPAILRAHQPLDWVLIALGTNDFKPRYGVAHADAVWQDLRQLAKAVLASEETSPGVLLSTPPPMGQRAGGDLIGCAGPIAQLARIMRAQCRASGIPLLDLHARLRVWRHLGPDQVHLNGAGRRRTAQLAGILLRATVLDQKQ